jgi:hypothetical protein
MLFALDVYNVHIIHPYTVKKQSHEQSQRKNEKTHSFLHSLTARLNTYQPALNKVLLLEREHFWHFIRMISLHPCT